VQQVENGLLSPVTEIPSMFMVTIISATKLCIECCREPVDRPYARCATCRKRKSQRERLRRAGNPEGRSSPSRSPDPAPAVELRIELEHHRTEGLTFDVAWRDSLAVILARIRPRTERESWSGTFWMTRGAWRSAYERTGAGPMGSMAYLADAHGTRTEALLLG
jgi:hypothetical protein